jgi:hypothetical protein
MAERARIAMGLAFLVTGLAVIGRAIPWIALPLELFAVFLIVWGIEPRATEAIIGKLSFGRYILKGLEYIDSVLSPRDREYDQHIQAVITAYNDDLRASLRTVFRTRNSSRILADHLNRFVADGLIEYPKDGPGWIKPELRRVVSRTLDELGA